MVDRKELRERAGLFYNDVISSPEYHAEKSALAKQQYDDGLTLKPEHRANAAHKKRKLSPAAIEMQRQKGEKARQANPGWQYKANARRVEKLRVEMRPVHELVVATYEAVVAERGMAYGAVKETAERLGWEESTTLARINAAWKLGMGSIDRQQRGTEETRLCPVCSKEFTVTRSEGWLHKTCSPSCGAKYANSGRVKPPRTAQCMVCQKDFMYKRKGTMERTLCDNPDCRRELSRRTGQRSPTPETRQKLSEAAKRRTK